MALDEVRRCSTCHGEDDFGYLIAAFDQKIIHRVRRTGLERHPPDRQLRDLRPSFASQHASEIDSRDAVRERNAATAGRVGTRSSLSFTGRGGRDLDGRILGSGPRSRYWLTFGPSGSVRPNGLVHVLLGGIVLSIAARLTVACVEKHAAIVTHNGGVAQRFQN
ncbi:hypothetical protein [Streptomyces sp. AC550_RSS872]|uniref:hypothetical protein n=1 Tax=Streptomyces sp. AC550_RSS872 TaxID=2823689 RepID=UPI001C2651A0|nr:hypothetical protein [Streptomyces sp. AC550_RSS872]